MIVKGVLGRTRTLPAQLQALPKQQLPGKAGAGAHLPRPGLISCQEAPMPLLGLADESRNKTSDLAADDWLTAGGQTVQASYLRGPEVHSQTCSGCLRRPR